MPGHSVTAKDKLLQSFLIGTSQVSSQDPAHLPEESFGVSRTRERTRCNTKNGLVGTASTARQRKAIGQVTPPPREDSRTSRSGNTTPGAAIKPSQGYEQRMRRSTQRCEEKEEDEIA